MKLDKEIESGSELDKEKNKVCDELISWAKSELQWSMPHNTKLVFKKMCQIHLQVEENEGEYSVTDRQKEKFQEMIRQLIHPNCEYMAD